jgi:hypothetical protein
MSVPKWSASTWRSIAYLFRPLQDVDIYVEDQNDETFYTELFKRIAPSHMKIARVVPLGNRSAVVREANSHNPVLRKALFLVDGDLDWVRGEPLEGPAHLVRLDAYCIENMLIDEAAIQTVLSEEAVLNLSVASTRLNFTVWADGIAANLAELFVWFAALNLVDPSQPTVSRGVGRVIGRALNGMPPSLDATKVLAETAAIRTAAETSCGTVQAGEVARAIRERISALTNSLDAISGKDYVFPLLENHLNSCGTARLRRSALRFRLAKNCSRERFSEITQSLSGL